jgi:DNA-binding NtrC family response regulator
MTVLVSYERLALRAAMYQLLTTAGYDVLVAPPSAALTAARLHGVVDVLVTDYVPPTEGKLDLAGRLKTEQPGLRVLYAPGADGPIESGAPFRVASNAAKLVTAVASLAAPDAQSSWGFCAL